MVSVLGPTVMGMDGPVVKVSVRHVHECIMSSHMARVSSDNHSDPCCLTGECYRPLHVGRPHVLPAPQPRSRLLADADWHSARPDGRMDAIPPCFPADSGSDGGLKDSYLLTGGLAPWPSPWAAPPSMPVENPAAVNSSVRPRSRKRACYGLSRLRTGEAAEAPHRSVRVVTIVGCGRRNA